MGSRGKKIKQTQKKTVTCFCFIFSFVCLTLTPLWDVMVISELFLDSAHLEETSLLSDSKKKEAQNEFSQNSLSV